jgi:drug/metabolite transporter (DMT)-like permease
MASPRIRGLFHLVVVYIVWGSTYLAIRIAVREGSGFPAFTMAGMRVLAASLILFAWVVLSGKRLRVGKRTLGVLAVSGVLLWLGGNGLVSWAERRADSGYSALLIGALPLWVTIMESIVDRRMPTWRLVAALLVGLAGVAVLNGPVILDGSSQDVYAAVALVAAAVSWGIGVIYQKRKAPVLDAEVSSGYQQLAGAFGLFLAALATGEPRPAPIPEAWAAWGYLVIFGSVIAFTSFIKALRLLPTSVVMTYAYVNPVVAVILGRLVLGEPINAWTVGGTVLIVLGVMGVFHERRVVSGREAAGSKASERRDPNRLDKTAD